MKGFSIIIPVYDRPDEIEEFLDSMSRQTDKEFEIIIMEGVGGRSCEIVCKKYKNILDIKFYKQDSGRSARRNEGMRKASYDYFLLFDSDCIIPPYYISRLREALNNHYVDCYGGGDMGDDSFTVLQKAVNYAMTSMMTTGGIRGGMKQVRKFLPRAFNMGFSREVFEKTGGYKEIIGEDVDLSMRIKEAGFSVELIKELEVIHKRRLTLKKFFKQVNTFGKARILLTKLHPGSLKIMHLFPSCFVLGHILILALGLYSPYFLLPMVFYMFCLFTESLIRNKSVAVAALSVLTSYIQLCGYGIGFIQELISAEARRKNAEELYRQ